MPTTGTAAPIAGMAMPMAGTAVSTTGAARQVAYVLEAAGSVTPERCGAILDERAAALE